MLTAVILVKSTRDGLTALGPRLADVETLIRMMAPALNIVLAVGERLSRVVEPDDPEYYPAHVGRTEAPTVARTGDGGE